MTDRPDITTPTDWPPPGMVTVTGDHIAGMAYDRTTSTPTADEFATVRARIAAGDYEAARLTAEGMLRSCAHPWRDCPCEEAASLAGVVTIDGRPV